MQDFINIKNPVSSSSTESQEDIKRKIIESMIWLLKSY